MKHTLVYTFFTLAIGLAASVTFTGCSTDDATEITYEVYVSPDLLAIAQPVVNVTTTDGQQFSYTLKPSDFRYSQELNISAGNVTMPVWRTSVHFDKFGVGSIITVSYKTTSDAAALSALSGRVLMAHGVVGRVNTRDKDGDWYESPIDKGEAAEVFTLPADMGALRTYLIDLANTPDQTVVTVNADGKPSVTFDSVSAR